MLAPVQRGDVGVRPRSATSPPTTRFRGDSHCGAAVHSPRGLRWPRGSATDGEHQPVGGARAEDLETQGRSVGMQLVLRPLRSTRPA